MQVVLSDEVFRSPIIQRRTITMLRLCRKIIFREFGVKLNLTQVDLVEQILSHAKRSRDRNLHLLADRLKNELDETRSG